MKGEHRVGDLVHIPQAVALIDCDSTTLNDPQLTIPLRVEETDAPKLGVVTEASTRGDYVRVFCDGTLWSVKNDSVYSLEKKGT